MLWRYDPKSPQLFTVPGMYTVGVLDLLFASGASSKPRSLWLMTALWFLPKFPQARVLCHTSAPWHIPQTRKQREIPDKWRPYSVFFLLTGAVETERYQRADCMRFSGHMMHMFSRYHFEFFCERPPFNLIRWIWCCSASSRGYNIKISMLSAKSPWIHWFGTADQVNKMNLFVKSNSRPHFNRSVSL